MRTLLQKFVLAIFPLAVLACGESGSPPDQFSEVQYRVQQEGGGTFKLMALSAGGRQRRLSADTVYASQGPVRFLVEGAPGPHSAELCRRSGGEITVSFTADTSSDDLPGQVRLTFESAGKMGVCRPLADACTGAPTGNACSGDHDCAPGDICEKRLAIEYPEGSGALASTEFAAPDVRFEVCQPIDGSACSVSGDPPTTFFGRVVSGSVGDIESTFIVTDETPAVYFLNRAQDNVSAIFRSTLDDRVQVQLFINNSLSQTESSTDEVIIRKDI